MSNLWRYDCWKKPNQFAAKPATITEIVDQSLDALENLYLDGMSVDRLRDHAKSKGIKVHPRAGRDKLMAAIKAAS